MIRPTPISRHLLRHATARSTISIPKSASIPHRFASTATGPGKKSSWKSLFARLGLAGGAIYYYNTSPIFGNEVILPPLGPEPTEQPPLTLDSLKKSPIQSTPTSSDAPVSTNPEALEAEAGQQGAFNEETGEINWDCPCLGGMAHGPCGPQFREAFSCFVFSQEDPKGMDCVDKFKGMQECFRAHPETYGAELEDDEDYTPPSDGPGELSDQVQSNLRPSEDVEKIEAKVSEAGQAVKEKAIQARDAAKEKASEVGQYVQDKAVEAKDKILEVRDAASAKASEVGHYAREKSTEARQLAQEKGSEAAQFAQQQAGEAQEKLQQVRGTASEKTQEAKKSLYETADTISSRVDDHLEKVKDPKRSA